MTEDTKLPVAKHKPWPKDEWYKVEYELPRVQYGHNSGEVVVLVVNENGDYHVSADVYDHAEREWVSWGGAYKVVAWRALPWPERGDMLTVEWLESFDGRSDEPRTKEPPADQDARIAEAKAQGAAEERDRILRALAEEMYQSDYSWNRAIETAMDIVENAEEP